MGSHSSICRNTKKLPSDRRAELHRELNRQTEDYDLTVRPVHEAADAAFKKRWSATLNVVETVPTTLAGMRAKIEFATSADFVFEALVANEERVHAFLDTLYRSAAVIAGLPVPSPTSWERDDDQEDA